MFLFTVAMERRLFFLQPAAHWKTWTCNATTEQTDSVPFQSIQCGVRPDVHGRVFFSTWWTAWEDPPSSIRADASRDTQTASTCLHQRDATRPCKCSHIAQQSRQKNCSRLPLMTRKRRREQSEGNEYWPMQHIKVTRRALCCHSFSCKLNILPAASRVSSRQTDATRTRGWKGSDALPSACPLICLWGSRYSLSHQETRTSPVRFSSAALAILTAAVTEQQQQQQRPTRENQREEWEGGRGKMSQTLN